jgi:hypothetical protein
MKNIKRIIAILIVATSSAFPWVAKNYKENIILDPKHCQTVHEIISSETTQNCLDSIKTRGNFKFKAYSTFLTDKLEILKSEENTKIQAPASVIEVNQTLTSNTINREIELRKTRALERQADALEDMSIVAKINLTMSIMLGVFLVFVLN